VGIFDAMTLRFTVVVPDAKNAAAFERRFAGVTRAEVVHGRWEDLPPHDCFVTAGNSYGIMSAGIDAAVVGRFGEAIQQAVVLRILNEYLGEQPVGTAFVLETGHAEVPLLVHAPTMRVPASIEGTDNVYRATRAALLAVHHHARARDAEVESVVFPAFGCGFGRVVADEAARQMVAAWKLFLEPPYPPDWDRILARERLIAWDGDVRRVK